MRVKVSDVAERDIWRLSDFLHQKNPRAADAAVDLILEGMTSLSDMADRGQPLGDGRIRELFLPFGRGTYILQYHVYAEEVVVLRIFHSREDR